MKDENKFLTDLSDSLDMKTNYEDISKFVNLEKYKKVNKVSFKFKIVISVVLVLPLLIFVLSNVFTHNVIETQGIPYDGIVNQDFKNGNYDGPYYSFDGHYFYKDLKTLIIDEEI